MTKRKYTMKSLASLLLILLGGTATAAAQAPDTWYSLSTSRTGDTVRLNDLEPHTWSYYTTESPIHSLNPVDVRIAYYGNGTNTVATSNNPDPGNTFTASTNNTVKVGNDASEKIFVYYKTLERADGDGSGTGRCPYRTIANPFSVRPTYGTDNTTKWRGFYKWRLKSAPTGGNVYNAAGTKLVANSTVDAEEELSFELSGTNKYMNVEFEALWARAYVNPSSNQVSNVERQFRVLTTNNLTSAVGYPATVSNCYPDGTNSGDYTVNFNTNGRTTYTCSYDTKFEYVNLRIRNLDGNGINLTIGRGVTSTDNRNVYGINSGYSASNVNTYGNLEFSLRIESGNYGNLYVLGNSTNYRDFYGTPTIRCTLGCDYDRAYSNTANDNSKLTIATGNQYYNIYGASGARFPSAVNKNHLMLEWVIKSGTFSRTDPGTATADRSIYFGCPGEPQYVGKRRLTLEGGSVANIAGSLNHSDARTGGNSGYNYNSTYTDSSVNDMVKIRVRGNAIVRGSIYGAAEFAGAAGGRHFVFTGGTTKGWIAGGCNGSQTNGGELYGNTFIYFGGKAKCNSGGSTTTINSSTGGNIFGAGSGITGGATVGQVSHSTIVIADDCEVERNVYGGGNYGYVNAGTGHGSDIYILGGTVTGKVFGGSNQQQGQIVNITMKGGKVIGGVYGGSNEKGTVAGPVTISIDGGTVGASGIDPETSEEGHVFGCGYGTGTEVSGKVSVTIGAAGATAHSDSPLINGNVYCGGHNAAHTVAAGDNTFTLTGQNGMVMGSVFGGGKGETAVIHGDTHVLLKGHINVKTDVFGGGHKGNVTGSTHVKITD